jgi:ABC-2 type transport system permease protein
MNPRRVGVLLGKELSSGHSNVMFTFAVALPLVFSFVISALMGTLFAGDPRLGIVDQGNSRLVADLEREDFIVTERLDSVDRLRREVESGALDMGVVLPADLDAALTATAHGAADVAAIEVYVWGESLIRDRTILVAALSNALIQSTGREIPLDIATVTVGEGENVPWSTRLFPFLVMITLFFGGAMLPATSLIDEKQRRTLRAVVTTPASLGDVFWAKGLMGGLLSLVMGLVVLALNRAFGSQPGLLVAVMALSAVVAVEMGLLLGIWIRDVNSLFAVVKAAGLLLYAPLFVYLFPQIPEWVARIWPTYYMVGPVVELSLRGGNWGDIALDVFILAGLILALGVATAAAARRLASSEAY